MRSLILALGLAAMSVLPHDFFVSILTIHHDPEQKTLELTWRMTAHDVEHALSSVALLKLNSQQEYPKADSLLNDYFHQHLHLFQKDAELSWKWVGREMEGENLFCYLQIEGVYTADDLSVSNTLLQDVFADQDNIVHLEAAGRTFTHHFLRSASPFTFTLQ